jgi:asparagine synthase (glutamine-hydrolysing)
MCGIAGILGRINDANRTALSHMCRAMAHRGPDGERTWVSSPDARGYGCLLGHRRLSILDLSTAADQPMIDPDGKRTIVFNGEIYNFRELKQQLAAAGHVVQSTGDTEVLLRMLSIHGHQAVDKLRGMFAFGVWDQSVRQLVLARDPLGIKPLYVCHNPNRSGDWSLIFASEVRAILASGLLEKPQLDPSAVSSVVWNGYVMGPGTIVQGIELLPSGEVQVLDSRGTLQSAARFWNMPTVDEHATIDENQLRDALAESIRLHLVSDVPLGVFFSGGVDSSAVATLAQKISPEPVNTFTLAFEEDKFNEGALAQRIAAAIGTSHRQVILTEGQFVSSLEAALDTLDQPTFDGLNCYYMSKACRDAGFTVALVGTGGDELFGGYTTFRYLPRLARFNQHARWVPRSAKRSAAYAIAALAQGFPNGGSVSPQTRWAKLPDMIDAGEDQLQQYQLAYALFLPDFHAKLLSKNLPLNGHFKSGLSQTMRQQLENETNGRSLLSAISITEMRCFLGERLLRDSDAASMAVSLELRLPFVDQVLTETVNRLPDVQRYLPIGQKSILRRIGLAGLDPALFDRPKSGFVLPFDSWIRKNLGKTMDATMRDEQLAAAVGLNGEAVARLWKTYQAGARGMYWSRVWAIYVLIRWCHQRGVLL